MKLRKFAGATLASTALVVGALFMGAAPANAAQNQCNGGYAIGGTPGYLQIQCIGSVRVSWYCSLAPGILNKRILPTTSTWYVHKFLACDIGYPVNIGWANTW